jgi:cytochrome P450
VSVKSCPVFRRLDRQEDVRSALENADLTVDHPALVSKRTLGLTILDIDGPKHEAGKRLLSKMFSAERVSHFQECLIRPTVRQVWSSLAGRGPVDVVRAIAVEIPPRVIFGILDLPPAMAVDCYLRDLAPIAAFRNDNRAGYREALDAHDRLIALVESRMSDTAQPRWLVLDDLDRQLENAITHEELVAALAHLLLAGTETTICALANLFYFIGEYPSSWEAVVDGCLAERHFVDEVLRFEPPAPRTFRFAKIDTAVGAGIELTRDSIVELRLRPANRTDTRIDAAEAWCPGKGRGVGASFGFGKHSCLGKGLALAEMLEVTSVLKEAGLRATSIAERDRIDGQIFRRPARIVADL